MTLPGENVVSGKPHPGTPLDIFEHSGGYVLAFSTLDGLSIYSIESKLYGKREDAVRDLIALANGVVPTERFLYSKPEDATDLLDRLSLHGQHPFGQQRLEDM